MNEEVTADYAKEFVKVANEAKIKREKHDTKKLIRKGLALILAEIEQCARKGRTGTTIGLNFDDDPIYRMKELPEWRPGEWYNNCYRVLKTVCEAIAEELERRGFKCRVTGGQGYYDVQMDVNW